MEKGGQLLISCVIILWIVFIHIPDVCMTPALTSFRSLLREVSDYLMQNATFLLMLLYFSL